MIDKERLARVLRNMEKEHIPCLLVTSPASVAYLTGQWIHPGERMLALMVKQDGEARLFANRLFALSGDESLPLTEYDDTDDCIACLAEALPGGVVGVDKFWPSQFTLRLMAARPDIRPVVGSRPVDEARLIKDAAFIDRMRASSRANDECLRRLIPTLRAGDTEKQVCRRYADFAEELGALGPSFDPLVCFGPHCAEPHHGSDNTPLQENQTVILDLGLNLDGAMSDMTRTVVLGRATDEMKRVYDLVKKANEAGRRAVRPGVPMCEIDRAARRVIEEGGYGPYFIHRTGHGIGLEVHEIPDVSATSQTVAQPGMIFSIEPGIYLPGRFGVRIEDLMLVTEDGGECLNALPRDLLSAVPAG